MQNPACGGCRCPVQKRIGEGKRQQNQKRYPKREQQKVSQPPVFGGTLYPLLKEHQRTKGFRRALMLPQKMQP
jgi:hypothetical protein